MSLQKDDIVKRIVALVADTLQIDATKIKPDATFETLGADSLDMLEVIMKLEEEFDIEIPDEEAEKIQTIDQAAERIIAMKK